MYEIERTPTCSFLIVASVFFIASCDSSGKSARNPKPIHNSDLPADWQLDEIIAAALPAIPSSNPSPTPVRSDVLAWQIIRDSRALIVESCVVVIELQLTGHAPTWVLAVVYRHPPDETWCLSMDFGSGKHCRAYQNRPTNSDIHSFVRTFFLMHKLFDDWETVDEKVCEKSWHTIIGVPPPSKP